MKHKWTHFERRAADIVRAWLNSQLERIADAGGLRLEVNDEEPTLIVQLLAELLADLGKEADADEMRAIRHERSLVAEELHLVLESLGIGPSHRHSPSNIYPAEAQRRVSECVTDAIGKAGVPRETSLD